MNDCECYLKLYQVYIDFPLLLSRYLLAFINRILSSFPLYCPRYHLDSPQSKPCLTLLNAE